MKTPAIGAVLLLLFISLSSAAPLPSLIRLVTDDVIYCDSWRLAVETNNIASWQTIPSRCVNFVKEYVTGERYSSDSEMVAVEAAKFAKTVSVGDDGKDLWVFDIDETLLSNIPYYATCGYGSEIYNETTWDEWVYLAKAPALQSSLNLYGELLELGFQIVLLTGRGENQRKVTEENLLFAGYHSWNQLILRQTSDIGKPAVVYKSERRAELEAQGFRIHGCSGDQWSDLMGSPMAKRSFKLPNPMYFIA